MTRLAPLTSSLLAALLAASPALAQDSTAYPPPPPPPAPADVYIPPPPPPPPEYLPPAPQAPGRRLKLRTSGHLVEGHSDVGLGFGEALGAAGMQLAATGVLALTTLFVTSYASETNMANGDFLAILGTIAVLAPPLMALPSSAMASKISKRCPRDHSWGLTYLAGVAAGAVTVGMATAWVVGVFGTDGNTQLDGLIGSLVIGAIVTGGFEALVLNLTGDRKIAAAPMVLKDGGGATAVVVF